MLNPDNSFDNAKILLFALRAGNSTTEITS